MKQSDVILLAREVWGQQAILPVKELEQFTRLIQAYVFHNRTKPDINKVIVDVVLPQSYQLINEFMTLLADSKVALPKELNNRLQKFLPRAYHPVNKP